MADQPQTPMSSDSPAAAASEAGAFLLAQQRVKTLSTQPGPAQMLRLYALYKQATLGDAAGDRPGMTDFVARAKYDGWAALRGTPAPAAMAAYTTLVDTLLAADA